LDVVLSIICSCAKKRQDGKLISDDNFYSSLHCQLSGVKVEPKTPGACNFGQMSIPHSGNKFNALQFHIHTYSEHEIEGTGNGGFFPAELHVVHQEETEESFAVFGTMIDVGPEPHAQFEGFLQGLEAAAQKVEDSCSALTSRFRGLEESPVQTVVQCAAPGSGNYLSGSTPSFWSDVNPNVYELPTNQDFGVFTYKGGLTTPGCTEIVNWNLLDTPMLISADQLSRLEKLILCYVAKEYEEDGVTLKSCRLATVASESGSTSRPPQPLLGRRVIHRCPGGPAKVLADIGVLPEGCESSSESASSDEGGLLLVIIVLVACVVAFGILYYCSTRSLKSQSNVTMTKEKMRTYMSEMDQRDFDEMFAAIDVDGKGTIEFIEFCVFVGNGLLKSAA
jgi:Eukaryotic-type carbonic anhydrase